MIEVFGGFKLSLKLLFFSGKLKLCNVVLSLDFSIFLFEPDDFSILFVDCFLIGALHFCNEFDPKHVLVEIGDDFDLKILHFLLFLFDENFKFFDLGGHGSDVLVVLCEL